MSCPFHFLTKSSSKEDATNQEPQQGRRSLLKGALGVAGGMLASGAVARTASAEEAMMPSMHDEQAFTSEMKMQPFYGKHQSGISTPQQAHLALVAFDVIAQDKKDLQQLFQTLTERCEFLMKGGRAETRDSHYPPMDSGILGPVIHPDNLTMTVSVGESLFDDRYGLAKLKPKQLQRMAEFPNDGLQADWCHGDLLIQICANSADTTLHALRDIIKHTPSSLMVRWRRDGFISSHAAASVGQRTPRNLLGFKDGTVNPKGSDEATFNQMIWVGDQHTDEPDWTKGGSYQAIRLIRFFVEHWDRTPLQEQQTIFGRNRDTGAPLGKRYEHDDPDYASDPKGERIPLDAHMRLANPRTKDFPEFLLLRRGYSYSYNTSPSGQLDVGLVFIGYQADLEKGFIATQNRLNGEPLEEYIKPFGGGYFFALPGVKDKGRYLAQELFESA
ncbi:Deferrochelatase/peroxidase EfeB precursor [Vibrio aerogenes CECT 7868]|uniref:Deferrochelatase n=1 Tax=Vibrio aerogenes CECT 7868 TaxID=1216006 RepID=A0A1M5ZUE9_9VIBR|nr:iron uptake transporter deferrochelatase/peroxidase subunit [Vibrio aerogenes]SHI27895.1 Deferrochelatase/peroxidase EfeB precursor [Vibrio aerogenes CECT 7868]